MRRHLSYANIMATVAVFIALGGSSYALTISGGNIKNRSITKSDVKKDTLTGKEIKESSLLKSVPKAKSATTADVAKTAGTATTATTAATAVNAKFATTASSATRLGNLTPPEFLRSGVLLRGSAVTNALSPLQILSLPALGAKLTTDGDADQTLDLRIDNTAAGATTLYFTTQSGLPTLVNAGAAEVVPGLPAVGIYSLSSASTVGAGYTIFCTLQHLAEKRIYCQAIQFTGP